MQTLYTLNDLWQAKQAAFRGMRMTHQGALGNPVPQAFYRECEQIDHGTGCHGCDCELNSVVAVMLT